MIKFDKNPWHTPQLQEFVQGTFLAAFDAWPKCYEDVERAMGVPLDQQTSKRFGVPEWYGDLADSYAVQDMILLCETFRFREAIARTGAQHGYVHRMSSPFAADFIEFFIESPPAPVSGATRLMDMIRGKSKPAETHRSHATIPVHLNWIDRALYHVDIQSGNLDQRNTTYAVSITSGKRSAFDDYFGPEYCALIDHQHMTANTLDIARSSQHRRRL